jgi:hypothetical protein
VRPNPRNGVAQVHPPDPSYARTKGVRPNPETA